MANIDKGEIYMVTCKVTGLGYVGQASNYITSNKQKWGASGRWTRHCYDAFIEGRGDYTNEFHKAIREYGKDNFELKVLCECDAEDMDEQEAFYIKKYNTLHPNGYNMTEGVFGKKCEIAVDKNKGPGRVVSEEGKKKMSQAFIGIRREGGVRKREEDRDLPKNITPIRIDDEIVGYQIKKFPMGITKPEYVYKTFKNKSDPEAALVKAKEHLLILKDEYNKKKEAYDKKIAEEKETEKRAREFARTTKDPLPNHIFAYISPNGTLMGYYVKGLSDFEKNPIPRRDFIEFNNSSNLDNAIKFINEVKKYNENKIKPENWANIRLPTISKPLDMPKYIRPTRYNGKETGYTVNYFVKQDEDKKKIYENKCFTNRNLTMEQKFELAKKYVAELNKKYNRTTEEDSESHDDDVEETVLENVVVE